MTQKTLPHPLSIKEKIALDNDFSNRHIDLDPAGYFLIKLDRDQGLIIAQHFTNIINDRGIACDPETGKPLPCNGGPQRQSSHTYTGRTAKELCIALFEHPQNPAPLSRLDHAAYLGREFQRAEVALYGNEEYIQD